jgi:hypothetical protein
VISRDSSEATPNNFAPGLQTGQRFAFLAMAATPGYAVRGDRGQEEGPTEGLPPGRARKGSLRMRSPNTTTRGATQAGADPRFARAKAEYEATPYGRRHRYPRAPERRCDAFANGAGSWKDWNRERHRCGHGGSGFRDGRWVCGMHRVHSPVEYTCGNHFDAFAEVMCVALAEDAS